jgi:hypothetical protein
MLSAVSYFSIRLSYSFSGFFDATVALCLEERATTAFRADL